MPMAVADLLPSRYYAPVGAFAVTVLASTAAVFDSRWLFLAGAAGVLGLLGIRDYVQRDLAQLSAARAFPLLFRVIRPEIRQYLLEGDNEAVPFSRAQRSLVISAPRTSRADSRSAPAKTCTSRATNGSTIHCVRWRSTILISA
jgi:hypothetical protein